LRNDSARLLEPSVNDARFVAEARVLSALPPAGRPEIAVAGRSNVGKSTLLNRLAQRKGLARTSKTPGRTRGMVFFELDLVREGQPIALSLVDLPGYGYAQVAKTERQSWQGLIEGYVEARTTLGLVVVLVDARRGLEDEELQLCTWLASLGKRFQIVFTKADKLSATERGRLKALARSAPRSPGGKAALFVSGETGENVAALWQILLAAAAPAAESEGAEHDEAMEQDEDAS
jgi:GTP-binding protein